MVEVLLYSKRVNYETHFPKRSTYSATEDVRLWCTVLLMTASGFFFTALLRIVRHRTFSKCKMPQYELAVARNAALLCHYLLWLSQRALGIIRRAYYLFDTMVDPVEYETKRCISPTIVD